MVHPLYWIQTLVYALVLFTILERDYRHNKQPSQVERSFRMLIKCVIGFCLQDTLWGLCAGEVIASHGALFAASTLFHASTVITTFFWLQYVLSYLGDRVRHAKLYLGAMGCIMAVQAALLIVNFFTPTIFYVNEAGEYATAFLRVLAFLNQYMVYLVVGIAAASKCAMIASDEERKRFVTVFMFTLGPILSGLFQYLYPDGPFYSMGYFLGCFFIHLFIVSSERETLTKLKNDREMAEQVAISHTDELTGLYNRRAYEDDQRIYPKVPTEDDYVYVSADVNGLKILNDQQGHAMGDELLRGAANVLKRCLGAYGKVYRIGGDEFAAMIFANEDKLTFIQQDLNEAMLDWHSGTLANLSISVGYASKREFPGTTVAELARIADERMYKAKAAYYVDRGIDRRGQHAAYAALCASYTKILRINLTDDSYRIIYMDTAEQTSEKGFAPTISQWLHDFGVSGQVHSDDLAVYLKKTDLTFLRSYFAENKRSINIFYKRLIGQNYRQAMMEMIIAEDYGNDKQSLYLYVKDIDR